MSSLFEIVDGKVIVTTSTGWKVECLPYADDLERAGMALVFPDKPKPPTYLMGKPKKGERRIRVPYTATSIDDENTPAKDTEAWGEYLLAMQVYNRDEAAITFQQSLMKARVVVHRATIIHDLPDLDAWEKERLDYYGIPLADNDKDRKLSFFSTEVAKAKTDVMNIYAGIMQASGASEEALDGFESLFRRALGLGEGPDAETDPQATPAETEDEEDGLVDGATVEPA